MAKLRLIDSPDPSTVYDELCWLIGLQNEAAAGLKQRRIVCVLSVTEWSASNVTTRIAVRTDTFSAAIKILPRLRIFVSRNR
jgi:hypothetical protein